MDWMLSMTIGSDFRNWIMYHFNDPFIWSKQFIKKEKTRKILIEIDAKFLYNKTK